MSKIKCPNCLQEIDSSDKFCPYCGAPVKQTAAATLQCPKCKHENPVGVSFCEKCGTSLKAKEAAPAPPPKSNKEEPKTFTSAGNYSGTMVKGKTSNSYKIFKRIILALVIVGVIAFVIWFKSDPNAGEKLFNVLFSAGFMLVFVFVIWRKAKKGKMISSRRREATYDWDDYDDDDDDDDDDYDDD